MTSRLTMLALPIVLVLSCEEEEPAPTTETETTTPAPVVDADHDGYRAQDGDCDDNDASVRPGAWETPYDGIDQDCDGSDLTDVDADGFDAVEVGGPDCDDQNAAVNPEAFDDCGGGDENCDGVEDDGQDRDGDGFSSCAGDCDDEDPAIKPGAHDVAQNGIDENCNGVDKGDCGDAFYEEERVLWFDILAFSCGGSTSSFGAVGLGEVIWTVPEDADCRGGSRAVWTDRVSGKECSGGGYVVLDGTFELDAMSGCGQFYGAAYACNGDYCADASGAIGESQDCI